MFDFREVIENSTLLSDLAHFKGKIIKKTKVMYRYTVIIQSLFCSNYTKYVINPLMNTISISDVFHLDAAY